MHCAICHKFCNYADDTTMYAIRIVKTSRNGYNRMLYDKCHLVAFSNKTSDASVTIENFLIKESTYNKNS